MSEYTSNQLKKIIDETTTAWSIPVFIAGGLYQFRYHQTRVGKVRETRHTASGATSFKII